MDLNLLPFTHTKDTFPTIYKIACQKPIRIQDCWSQRAHVIYLCTSNLTKWCVFVTHPFGLNGYINIHRTNLQIKVYYDHLFQLQLSIWWGSCFYQPGQPYLWCSIKISKCWWFIRILCLLNHALHLSSIIILRAFYTV